jgi:hypothetical protein
MHRISRETVERDVACLVRSYSPAAPDRKISQEETYDSPLTDLGLLRREPASDRITIERSPRPTLPPGIVAFAVLSFWERNAGSSNTISFEQLAYERGSPGQVFKLSENALVEYLEALTQTAGRSHTFSATSGLRQVMRTSKVEPLKVLRRHYRPTHLPHAR